MMAPLGTLAGLAAELAAGRTSSVALTELCLERIDSQEDGRRAFIRIHRESALAAARAADSLRARGAIASELAGIPVSVKDLFDIAGEITTAGSVLTEGVSAATRDALIVSRLRAAGAVILGTTNMTEAAYSALGLNPHYGTPRNRADPARIPGGSSSGAAAAVAYGCSAASIGTDTAGSVRVPAALCGLTGLKPTQARVSRQGVFPLSESLDSVGPIAASVACCALLDAIMAARAPAPVAALTLSGLRLAVPTQYLTEGLEDAVARAFDHALDRLSAAGARVTAQRFETFACADELEQAGRLLAAEALAVHKGRLAAHGDRYDPRVRVRLEDAARLSADDYQEARHARGRALSRFAAEAAAFDAVLSPTVPLLAPLFQELERDADYRRINAVVRRNTATINALDACALSLPCQSRGALPVGLMAVAGHDQDARLHAVGAAIERALKAAGLG